MNINYFDKSANVDLNESYRRMKENKKNAILKILKVLNSRMAVMSKPMRDEALTLADFHDITARTLIEQWAQIVEGT